MSNLDIFKKSSDMFRMISSSSLICLIGPISCLDIKAQSTMSFETDFSNPADYGNWVSLSGQPSTADG
jgi:hypothetical protein